MRYSPNILALYGQLYKEAHVALEAEAAGFTKEGRGFVRRLFRMGPSKKEQIAALKEQNAALLGETSEQAAAQADLALNKRLLEAELQLAGAEPGGVAGIHAAKEEALQQAARAKMMRNLGLGAGVAGLSAGGVAAPLAYRSGQQTGAEGKTRTRNLAFGTGLAAGVTAPHIIRGLGHVARSASGTGLFPGFQQLGAHTGGY